jgi:tRNA/tmRNA/rRNA uracil-C5-methylase (TrmA/RlmC/RlmD family)
MKSVIKRIYNTVFRRKLPRKISSYNGVPVRDRYLFDITDLNPYKPKAIDIIGRMVQEDDTVVDIAAGYGVFSVVAARNGASVKSYDANPEKVALARETAELSFVGDSVTVSNAVVGEVVGGPPQHSERIQTLDSVPECNVLILDVEGAETSILRNLSHSPRTILVEAHPHHDATVDRVTDILYEKGYAVDSVSDMLTHSKYFITAYSAD